MSDIGVSQDGFVATVEMRRPPHNFFDSELIAEIGEAFERLDADPRCRAIVLAAEGRSFCAGADFSKRMETGTVAEGSRSGAGRHLYKEAIRLFRTRKPVIAAVQGAAVGGGLGLALVADFRVTCEEARFSANFNRLGFHPGFRPDRDPAASRRRPAGGTAVLYRPSHSRRRSRPDRARRPAGAARRGAQRRSGIGARDRAIGAARRHGDRARRCAAASATRSRPPPSASSSSRTGCAAPRTSGGHQGDGRAPPARLPRPLESVEQRRGGEPPAQQRVGGCHGLVERIATRPPQPPQIALRDDRRQQCRECRSRHGGAQSARQGEVA